MRPNRDYELSQLFKRCKTSDVITCLLLNKSNSATTIYKFLNHKRSLKFNFDRMKTDGHCCRLFSNYFVLNMKAITELNGPVRTILYCF